MSLPTDDKTSFTVTFLWNIDQVFQLRKTALERIHNIHSKQYVQCEHHISMKLMMDEQKTAIHLCVEEGSNRF